MAVLWLAEELTGTSLEDGTFRFFEAAAESSAGKLIREKTLAFFLSTDLDGTVNGGSDGPVEDGLALAEDSER